MYVNRTAILADKQPFWDTIDLYITEERGTDADLKRFVAHDFQLTEVSYLAEPAPSLSISKGEAVILMDSLWRLGIRPTKFESNDATLEATKYHLEDMRTLVFKEKK